ncbi:MULTISPECIES: phosphate ABC transporter substrate-binding protein PstS [Mycobacterium]|uniref:Phosphate-binding protein n=1 Tax=Mycobacterium persicum TaxID=1487726 RepID=A0A1X0L7N2_9MYCO|nr:MULTISPECIES: phosphate ABC transporter substrate-binding protein PstS [Mycobacterium]ARG63013.1 phosphate ABC transporter substrate-binding protein PstS [Mycobacterium kansasii]KZS80562.1 phosphate ABC transporter substrate-binding protein PstS [Mycobacterium persicum]ORB94984.1 phosphate ABC transporter substrate-binding protein PstS [Mycobacterium persicum]ORC01732.1 phosphate ABC transporter substrate-binding protein PstS [Mycobacterium persicum]ORC06979.1 phosphate ABC transporter subs
MRLDTVGRAFAAAVAVITACGGILTACGSDQNLGGSSANGSGAPLAKADCSGRDALTAEGSTAQQNAMALFNQVWGRACPGKKVSYNPTGSGAGREQFIAGHVDFAGSDSPLVAEQIGPAANRCKGNPAWDLPLVFGPIALVYNLAEVKTLVLDADTMAKIFSGSIRTWNDPILAALNPGVALPNTKIIPVYRKDSSGTTDNFQKYLTAAAPQSWSRGVGGEFHGGVGEGVERSAGVIQAVQVTPGSIGYVEKGFADRAGIPFAQIDTGNSVVPLTEETARKAIDSVTFAASGNDLVLELNSIFAIQDPGAYPLVLATYEIVCSKGYPPDIGAAVKAFLTTAVNNGQTGLPSAGYVPVPDRVKERLVTAINALQ